MDQMNAVTANIIVTYDAGFQANPAARAAFQAAVEIWQSTISTPVTIRVSAFANASRVLLAAINPPSQPPVV